MKKLVSETEGPPVIFLQAETPELDQRTPAFGVAQNRVCFWDTERRSSRERRYRADLQTGRMMARPEGAGLKCLSQARLPIGAHDNLLVANQTAMISGVENGLRTALLIERLQSEGTTRTGRTKYSRRILMWVLSVE